MNIDTEYQVIADKKWVVLWKTVYRLGQIYYYLVYLIRRVNMLGTTV